MAEIIIDIILNNELAINIHLLLEMIIVCNLMTVLLHVSANISSQKRLSIAFVML